MGEVRQFIWPIPDHLKSHKRDSDVELTGKQATVVVESLEALAHEAPSYEDKLRKLLKRGYRIIACGCPMFHLVELSQVKIHAPSGVYKPGGSQ